MTCTVAVTFEFRNDPAETWRGTITATGPQTVVSRAVVAAKRAHPNRQWTSLVVCILDRQGDEQPESPAADAVEATS